MILKDSTRIGTTPNAIFGFFEEMERNYVAWHPDHLLFRWVSGRGVNQGTVFYFEERIGGKLLKKKVVFTRIVPGQHIEFTPTFWLLKLFLPRLLFRIVEEPEGCLFTAELHLRMGPLAARLNKRELDAVRLHMHEEGENLKRLLEEPAHAPSVSDTSGRGIQASKE